LFIQICTQFSREFNSYDAAVWEISFGNCSTNVNRIQNQSVPLLGGQFVLCIIKHLTAIVRDSITFLTLKLFISKAAE